MNNDCETMPTARSVPAKQTSSMLYSDCNLRRVSFYCDDYQHVYQNVQNVLNTSNPSGLSASILRYRNE